MAGERKSYHEEFADKIIEALQKGTAPWVKPWEPGAFTPPFNPISGTQYRGSNFVSLAMEGNADPRFMTFKQANSEGWRVKKGEKSRPVVFWQFTKDVPAVDEKGKPILDAEGNQLKRAVELERPILRFASVFNGSQIEGIPEWKPVVHEWNAHERCEAILANSGAKIAHDQRDRAFYRPSSDDIHLPPKTHFETPDRYYATALHELDHWTGHPSRMGREFGFFGSEAYAREELRAEIASWMTGLELGIGHDPKQHEAYVASWIKVLKEDPYEIVRACRDAEKIKGMVMGFELEKASEAVMAPSHPQEQDADLSQAPAANPAPSKTYLHVPFEEKEQAKAAGARWDRKEKLWFAPTGTDLNPLERWMGKEVEKPAPALSPEAEFAEALRELGLDLQGSLPAMDGKMHRVATFDKPNKQNGVYQGFLDGRPAGWAENKRTGERMNWKATGCRLSQEQVEGLRAEALNKRLEREQERERQHEGAALAASRLFMEAEPAKADHPYCKAKGIDHPIGLRVVPDRVSDKAAALGVRIAKSGQEAKALREADPKNRVFIKGDLLIPLYDAAGKLWNLQAVSASFKSYMKDARKQGLHAVAGSVPSLNASPLAKDKRSPLVLVEGYATGDAVAKALGLPVVVTFDSGNLLPVAKDLRERFPDRPIVIAGDNDHHLPFQTDQGGRPLKNVGEEKALAAAEAVGGVAALPTFERDDPGTDWNDVASSRGVLAVREALAPVVAKAMAQAADRSKSEDLAMGMA